MADKQITDHIDALAQEEHALFEKESHGKASDADRARLQQIGVLLDQSWDLLRQRRAKREFGQNPNEARPRDPKTIKNYSG
ncbi:MAG TPA: DUF2630 family protein [Stellaceae bacterium]|jgi:hypothetical protein|nr:DUF2630 family protein [Stellaceae bacterium]